MAEDLEMSLITPVFHPLGIPAHLERFRTAEISEGSLSAHK